VSRRIIAACLAAVTMLALTGCGREQPLSTQVGTQVFDVPDRQAMPPVSGTTLTGQPLDLADYRGRVVVLNSWASWCAPCRDEVPALVSLAASADPGTVAIVGLNVDDDPTAARAFAKEFAMPYPSIVDSTGTILPTIPGVPPAALPSTVIIDAEGRIAARIVGPVDGAHLAGLVASIQARTPAP
jgi:thiol-disulfide isomerase/thioredoxin